MVNSPLCRGVISPDQLVTLPAEEQTDEADERPNGDVDVSSTKVRS